MKNSKKASCCENVFCCHRLLKHKFIVLVIIAAVLGAGFLVKTTVTKKSVSKFQKDIIPGVIKKVINDSKAKFTISSVKETSGVYEFALTVGEGNNAQKYVSYISKDGKLLFTSGIKLDSLKNKAQVKGEETTPKKLTCNDLSKAETPNLTAFIVSGCPYGLQMQRVLKKALSEAPGLDAYLTVRYIGSIEGGKITSMHGDQEAAENLNQICIREEQKDKYWPYVACYMQEGKGEDCFNSAGVDTTQLKSCVDDQNRGLKYAQADFDLANKFKVSGSPTLIVNNSQTVSEFDFGGRVADAVKQIVCCASKNKGDFCSQELSKDEVASSFSSTDAASATTNSSGGCAQ